MGKLSMPASIYSLVFSVTALISAILAFSEAAGTAIEAAQTVCLISSSLAVITLVRRQQSF
jgi:uncharacterized membrane protein YtjA (UPF0391 family)